MRLSPLSTQGGEGEEDRYKETEERKSTLFDAFDEDAIPFGVVDNVKLIKKKGRKADGDDDSSGCELGSVKQSPSHTASDDEEEKKDFAYKLVDDDMNS